jgi:enoyl-CoA hydratase/carnithine racemase
MMSELVQYHRDGTIGTIRLNRPEQNNEFNAEMLAALDAAMVAAEEDIDAKFIVIEAAGDHFSVGADAAEVAAARQAGPAQRLTLETAAVRRFEYLTNFLRPTVAVVQGRCVGVGLTIAMSCDFVICSADATLEEPAVKEGNLPSFALWPFFAWHKKARELLFNGSITAPEAAEWGIISSSVPTAELEAEVGRYGEMLALAPADAMVWMKEMISATLESRGGGNMWQESAVYHALGTE